MGRVMCWYGCDIIAVARNILMIASQLVAGHIILRRNPSTRIAQPDLKQSNVADGFKNPSNIRTAFQANQQHRQPWVDQQQRSLQMVDRRGRIALDHQVKKQHWIQRRQDMLRRARDKGSGRRASTRQRNLLGRRREIDSVEGL
jgi:hypothetical protein